MDGLITAGALIFLGAVLFFWGREFVWWYWGIDKALRHLESIDESLRCLPAVRESRGGAKPQHRIAS